MSKATGRVREKLLKEVLVLEDRISAEVAELLETNEEMKKLMMERMNMKAEEWRDSDHCVVVSSQLAESGIMHTSMPDGSACLFANCSNYFVDAADLSRLFPKLLR